MREELVEGQLQCLRDGDDRAPSRVCRRAAAGFPTPLLSVNEPTDAGPVCHFLSTQTTGESTPAQLYGEILSKPLPIIVARYRLLIHVFQLFDERLPVWAHRYA